MSELRRRLESASSRRWRYVVSAEQDALDRLGPDVVSILARYEGQTLDELNATFELLPLGTRLALDQVGALELLDNEGEGKYGVQVLPFALDLVAAAGSRVGGES